MNLPQLPQDKANHALYGALIYLVAHTVAIATGHAQQARMIGVAAAALAGMFKEFVDWMLNRRAMAKGLAPPHGVELADVLATVSGAFICFIAVTLEAL